ncbi:MAG TPA: Nramp family divalent metal transporter [Fimbriimonadaceae bacterium]|nr:Nramp family divalent metal transporter [Fimbriimonadaceae bacterium]
MPLGRNESRSGGQLIELKAREAATAGWRAQPRKVSLPEVYRSIAVPANAPVWLRFLAFFGPGYLVAVGYMDPGNWETDIVGGARFRFTLLSVVLISNFVAIFLQALAAKLGIVTGRDLAQACNDAYRRPAAVLLWISAEIGIIACDIAEVIGAAIALNLLFHIPLAVGVVITAADVLLVLALQHKGFRWIETLVIVLIATMMVIFAIELVYAKPDWFGVLGGFLPSPEIVTNPVQLYVSLGILGATVMPHNLYLHSSIIQTRRYGHAEADLKDSIRLAYTDSTVALMLALFVNAAILILAAAAFHGGVHQDTVRGIGDAYQLLTPVLGTALAAPLFAIALLASGQNSTLTGTLAGQIILEGFTDFRIKPWARRLISRGIAIVPAVFAVAFFGWKGIDGLILFSQVVLSAQLSFAVVPLIQFTSDKAKMGPFVNGPWTKAIGWSVAAAIAGLNAYLIVTSLVPGLAPS